MNGIANHPNDVPPATSTRPKRTRKSRQPEAPAQQPELPEQAPISDDPPAASRSTLRQTLTQRWRQLTAAMQREGVFSSVPEPVQPLQASPQPAEPTAHGKAPDPISTPGQEQMPLPLQSGDPTKPYAIPLSLQKRYFIGSDNKYYFRDRQQALAFEDLGHRLSTAHDDPDVAVSMVELAQAKGWTKLKLSGSKEFKREAWLAAAERGLEVSGHQPSPADKARLEQRVGEHEDEQRARENQIEKQRPAVPETAPAKRQRAPRRQSNTDLPSAPIKSTANGETDPKTATEQEQLNPQQRAALTQLKSFLRQRGDSDAAIEMTAAVAAQALVHHRAHFGELLEHGPARYQHNPDNDMSYFATLRTPQGRQTIWGIDLGRSLAESGSGVGDGVVLVQPDHRPVTVSKPERDGEGKATGRRIAIGADRNRWEVLSLDNARDFAEKSATPSPAQTKADVPTRSSKANRKPDFTPDLVRTR